MMPGAAWHMPFTAICSSRKSPLRSVSLTWMSGWSPSPLVFTAPLMPPCAHTEWLRFTGTMLKTSTCWPASASLITVIKPASPPPTTAKRPLTPASAMSGAPLRVGVESGRAQATRPRCRLELRGLGRLADGVHALGPHGRLLGVQLQLVDLLHAARADARRDAHEDVVQAVLALEQRRAGHHALLVEQVAL